MGMNICVSGAAEHYSLAYMAMRAHILLGQADAAAEELHTLATHSQAPTGLCLKAMGVRCAVARP